MGSLLIKRFEATILNGTTRHSDSQILYLRLVSLIFHLEASGLALCDLKHGFHLMRPIDDLQIPEIEDLA